MSKAPKSYRDCIKLHRELNGKGVEIPIWKIAWAFGVKLPDHDDLMERLAAAKSQNERFELLAEARSGSDEYSAIAVAIEKQTSEDLVRAKTIKDLRIVFAESLSGGNTEKEVIIAICTI